MPEGEGRSAVRDFWRVYGGRRSGDSTRDIAVMIYGAGLVLLTYVSGLVSMSVDVLRAAEDERAGILAGSPGWLAGAVIAGVVAAFGAGTVRGPVLVHPFLVSTLAGTALARRVSLRRLAVRAVLVLAAAGLVCGILGSVSLVAAQWAPWWVVPAAAAVGGAYGALTSVAWLAGQAAVGPWVSVPVVVGAIVALTAVVGASLFQLSETAVKGTVAGLVLAVVVMSLAVTVMIPRLLDMLRAPVLVAQAHRWQGALMFARAGLVTDAASLLRLAPSVGRRWRLPRGPSFARASLVSDLGGAARTPSRLTGGLVGLGVAGWMTAAALDAGFEGAILWGAAAGLVGLMAVGPFCDGLRHAVDAVTTPRIYGRPDAQVLAVHMAGPTLVASLVVVGTTVSAGTPIGQAVLGGLMSCVLLVIVRGYDASRGPLPLSLTVPVASPIGDVSGLSVALWQADAALIAATGGALVALSVGGTATLNGAALLLLVAGGGVAGWRRRLGR